MFAQFQNRAISQAVSVWAASPPNLPEASEGVGAASLETVVEGEWARPRISGTGVECC